MDYWTDKYAKPAQTLSVDQSSVDMKQRSVSVPAKSYEHCGSPQICATLAAVLRKSFRQSQMSTMGFIHDQRNSFTMYQLCDRLYICDPAFISG